MNTKPINTNAIGNRFKVSSLEHGENRYSLNITIEDCHVENSSWHYSNRPGLTNRIVIYGLSLTELQELSSLLAEVVFLTKLEMMKTREASDKGD